MKIKELQAYKDLEEMFYKKGYLRGVKDEIPMDCWSNPNYIHDNLTHESYAGAIN